MMGATMHVRKDDIVEVITGDDAGGPKGRTTGRVMEDGGRWMCGAIFRWAAAPDRR